jgi:2',3'-cyclic-nucleotide 2'-phosphodiesterase/3'-nucleotidase
MNRLPAPRHLAVLVCAAMLAACATAPSSKHVADGTRATLAVIETTDLHSNIRSFDYYQDKDDPTLGLERAATLVKQARKQYENSLLFDAGDTIQGTALADYQALVKPVGCDEELAIYRAMDSLNYDGGTVGNHEFNYGLPFLAQVTSDAMNVDGVTARHCDGPHYPLVLSNVYSKRDDQPIYPPYAVLERTLKVQVDGKTIDAPIRIGIIGFTPPPIMMWDKRNLEGKVYTKGLVEAAREYLPKLRAQNVDFTIAISHGGIDRSQYTPDMENANLYLAQEPGIDVLLLGHSHTAFPESASAGKRRFADIDGVDDERGFIHGKPTVMGNFWGKSVGLIELGLVREGGHWKIDPAKTHSEVRDIKNADGSTVAPDAEIAKLVEPVHEATRRYVATPIGDSDYAMTTYFADVGDVTALQPVNTAQAEYARRILEGIAAVQESARAVRGGAVQGRLRRPDRLHRHSRRPARDPQRRRPVPVPEHVDRGEDRRRAAQGLARTFGRTVQPHRPGKKEPQDLINRHFSGYNFDVIQNGLTYAIDVTQAKGSRIADLRYNGKPVDAKQEFIVVTNNYRASGGGKFPGIDGSNIVLSAPDGNREVLIDWVREHKHLVRAQDGANRNWHFAPVKTVGPVTFTSASGKLDLAKADGITHVRLLKDNGDGTSTYAVDLAAPSR